MILFKLGGLPSCTKQDHSSKTTLSRRYLIDGGDDVLYVFIHESCVSCVHDNVWIKIFKCIHCYDRYGDIIL